MGHHYAAAGLIRRGNLAIINLKLPPVPQIRGRCAANGAGESKISINRLLRGAAGAPHRRRNHGGYQPRPGQLAGGNQRPGRMQRLLHRPGQLPHLQRHGDHAGGWPVRHLAAHRRGNPAHKPQFMHNPHYPPRTCHPRGFPPTPPHLRRSPCPAARKPSR